MMSYRTNLTWADVGMEVNELPYVECQRLDVNSGLWYEARDRLYLLLLIISG